MGGLFKLHNMNKTAMQEMIEWLQSYEYEIPLQLQIKAKELLEKEKEQIIDAYEDGQTNVNEDGCLTIENGAEEYYKETYNQNK